MIYKSSYGEAIISGSKDDLEALQNRISIRKRKPSNEQLDELRRYLRDFEIRVHIPEFNTVAEMDAWKIKQVKEKLGY